MKHIVIISGGSLNPAFVKTYMKSLSYDRLFVADKGLEYAKTLELIPDYVVGDFDTVNADILDEYEQKAEQSGQIVVERHPARKDETDTELAVWKAMEKGAEQITLFGATGTRLDHVFANVGLLKQTVERNIEMFIVDETNRIRIVDGQCRPECCIRKEQHFGTYLSLVALTDEVCGVTLRGLEYPLTNATIYRGSSRTVSNQMAEKRAYISIRKGQLLIMESSDEWKMDAPIM